MIAGSLPAQNMSMLVADGRGTGSSTGEPSANSLPGKAVLTAAETSATAAAAASGTPVPVTDETTPTNQVLANPDGTFTLHANIKPVRVRADQATEGGLDPDGDGWVPVDTTLHVGADGRLEPKAAATPLSLSPGGDTSIVTVTAADNATSVNPAGSPDAGASKDASGNTGTSNTATGETGSLTLKWPTPLPTPSIAGSTATYPNVMPGVDLAVTANVDSYSEVLVVKTAQAAANPQLAHVGFAVDLSPNLKVSEAGAQTLTAVDSQTGQQVFSSATPVVWDSTTDPNLGPKPTVTDPGGSALTALDVAVAQDSSPTNTGADATVSVAVPSSELAGSGVTYPVYIDPSIGTRTDQASINVQSDGSSYYQPTDFLRSGLCGWSGCNTYNHIDRSFSAFDVHELTGRATTAVVSSGRVYAREVWNAGGCAAQNVGLWSAHGFGTSTVWSDNTAISLLQTINTAAGGGSACPAADLQFADGGVTARFQVAANADATQLVFGFLSYDEGNRNAWKKYDINPRIEVDYSFPPLAPGSLKASNTFSCAGDSTIWEHDSTPLLTAVSTDVNSPAAAMKTTFTVYRVSPTPTGLVATGTSNVASGTTASWTTPTLTDGSYYFLTTATNSAGQTSSATQSGTFVVDTTPPPNPSDVYSFTNPITPNGDHYGQPANASPGGTIHVASAGAHGFVYTWDNSTVPAMAGSSCATNTTGNIAAPNGDAYIPIPGTLTPGVPHYMYVKAYDNAHNETTAAAAGPFWFKTAKVQPGPTVLEGETAPFTTVPSDMVRFNESAPGATSGNAQEHFVATGANQSITYPFTVASDGVYEVQLGAYTSNHHATLTVAIDGQTVLDPNGTGDPSDPNAYVKVNLYSGAAAARRNEILASPQLQAKDASGQTIQHTVTLTTYSSDNRNDTSYVDHGVHDNGYAVAVDYIRVVNSTPPATTDHLDSGSSLSPGSSLWSPGGSYQFTLQTDGNAVVYRASTGAAVFSSHTSGSNTHLDLQTDANLVLYSSANNVLWSDGVNRTTGGPFVLKMQDDGNLVEYTSSGAALWSSLGGLVK